MPEKSDTRSRSAGISGFSLLAFILGCINIASYAAEYVFDGNWVGKGYTSGDVECPDFEVYMSVAGHHVEARNRTRFKVRLNTSSAPSRNDVIVILWRSFADKR